MILIQGGSMVLTGVCLSLFEDENIATCCNVILAIDRIDGQ
jgi:hypothetical protein